MRVGSLAPEFQPDDPRLHDNAAHPLAGPAPLGRELQSIGRRLSPTDAATSSFPGSTRRAIASPIGTTAALRRRPDPGALRLRHGLHHLRDEGARSPRRGAASITNFSGSESKVGSVVAAHAQELAPATPAKQAAIRAARIMALKKKRNAERPTL